jgi:hypothetical protein
LHPRRRVPCRIRNVHEGTLHEWSVSSEESCDAR